MAEIPIQRKPKRHVLPLILLLVIVIAAAWYFWANSTTTTTAPAAAPTPTSMLGYPAAGVAFPSPAIRVA